jgi:hypothetical protein
MAEDDKSTACQQMTLDFDATSNGHNAQAGKTAMDLDLVPCFERSSLLDSRGRPMVLIADL